MTMYEVGICDLQAEVLGRRVVVQHLPLGGIVSWDDDSTPLQASPSHELDLDTVSVHTAVRLASASGPSFPVTQLPTSPHGLTHGHSSILPARTPLGPTASTALRITHLDGQAPSQYNQHLNRSSNNVYETQRNGNELRSEERRNGRE